MLMTEIQSATRHSGRCALALSETVPADTATGQAKESR